MDVSILNSEDVKIFIKTYRKAYGWELNDTEIKDCIARGARSYGVNWLNPFGIFEANEISLKKATLVELVDTNKYNWMDS